MALRVITHAGTGEIQCVGSLEGYGEDWIDRGELPEGVAPEYATWNGAAIVEELNTLQAQLLAQIDRDAGAFRQRFITSIPGQEATYLEKESQARAWLDAEDPDENEAAFGMLKAEADHCGLSVAVVAATAAAKADFWRQLNWQIEGRRLGAKAAVKAATTRAGKIAAAAVDWEALLP